MRKEPSNNRLSAVAAILLLAAPAMVRADSYFHWTGAGADTDFSTAENWQWGQAPSGDPLAKERLFFIGGGGQLTNDLSGAAYQELYVEDGSYHYLGNTADVAQLTLALRNSNNASLFVGADIQGTDIFFDYDDFREDQSVPSYLQFGVGSEIHLTGEAGNRFSTYGFGAFQSQVLLAGANGRIVTDGPGEAWVGSATLTLGGGNEPGTTERIDPDIHVYLDHGSRLQVNGLGGSPFTATVAQLTVVGSAIITVTDPTDVLNIPTDITAAGLALYNASNGSEELGAATSPAPRIFLQGQSDSSFLGPQQFYLNGDVNWGGGYAPYEFAAYDTDRGVISATTLSNPADLSMATPSDVVQIDSANPAALADDPDATRDYKLTGNAKVKALAFNGDLLYSKQEGEPGPLATLAVEHILVTHDSAAIAVNLDFEAVDGTITTENWDLNRYPEVDVLGDIAGTKSLTVRGYGELNYRAAASFSGELVVAGGYLNLADSGSFANVETIEIGTPGESFSSLELYGVDNTGATPVVVNRLNDNVHIIVQGESELSLESDTTGVTPTTEKIGAITVTGTGTAFSLMVQAGDLNTHSAASAAGWEVASLAFDAAAESSSIALEAYGDGNTIKVNGGPIMLENGNILMITQHSGGRVITQGIGIAADSFASLYIGGRVEGNVDLQGGYFFVVEPDSAVSGNLTLGEGSQMTLWLSPLADDASASPFASLESPILFVDGDLTLGGALYVAQNGGFQTGSWLAFRYTGDFVDLGWTINGMDGDYTLTVDELSHSVYLNAVPEPSTFLLIALGLFVLAFRSSRDWHNQVAAIRKTLATICGTAVSWLTCGASAHAAVTFDWAAVGNAGNAADTKGYGAVAYDYKIATTEVNLFQYTAFLNAAAQTDVYGLYNTSMGSNSNIAGISRSGSSGSYVYSVVGSGSRPVTYVSWFDAARFANWVANGQPTGTQAAGTTEDGAYTLNGATSGTGFTKNAINPNTGTTTTHWIPSEDEWYKAAYYQPVAQGGPSDSYWLYPTRSDNVPGNEIGAGANQANYYAGDYAVTQSSIYSSSQNYLTDGGSFTNSASYYGTFDQGGNVWEWNDAVIGSSRGLRGGSWNYYEGSMGSTRRNGDSPSLESNVVGFRVASVPEPSAALLMMLGGAAWTFTALSRRRGRNAGVSLWLGIIGSPLIHNPEVSHPLNSLVTRMKAR